MVQSALASSNVVPQKNELVSSDGVDGKHGIPMGQSPEELLGHVRVHVVAASVQVQVVPQAELIARTVYVAPTWTGISLVNTR